MVLGSQIYIKLQTTIYNCYISIEKDTVSVKKDTVSVKKDTVSVIFACYIPCKRARVLELWNIEMLHQGREENPEKRYLGCLRTRKIQENRTNEPKSTNEKQQRKNYSEV